MSSFRGQGSEVSPCGVAQHGCGQRSARFNQLVVGLAILLLLGLVPAAPSQAAPRTIAPQVQSTAAAAPTRVNCARPPYDHLVNGINIDKTCQRAYFVSKGKVVRKARVSTGMAGYRTRSGNFRIYRRLDRWAESKIYKGAMMYRPMFFSGGQAIHGSVTDALVKPYPASHGCVRMPHRDVDWLWRNGWGVGTRVHVFYR